MKPFLILHSVTGILTGCDYINSHAIFPWVTDHMRFFGHETDSKFRSENVCVCVCPLKRKKTALEQFSHSKTAIQFVGVCF